MKKTENNDYSVLVVDDDDLVRKLLTKFLQGIGYRVDVAEDGESALERLGKISYDLVLTDLQMPRLGGRELLEHMSHDYSHIPKIVLTGHGTNDDILAALKAGAYDFLYKPIDDLNILEYSIKRAVESKRLREDKERHLVELEKNNEIISMLNSGKSTDEIFNMLNLSLKKIIPFDGMFLTLLNDTNTFLTVENAVFNHGFYHNLIRTGDRYLASQLNVKNFLNREQNILNIDNLGNYIREKDSHDVFRELCDHGIKSILGVSLLIKDQARGIIFFISTTTGAFKNHHITFVKSIAGQIALSVQRTELTKEIENHSRNLEKLVSQRTEEVLKTQRTTIFALSSLADARDSETGDHLERIRNYAVLLMRLYKYEEDHMEISNRLLRDLYDSSVLHDIGKVGIPDQILLKKSSLTKEEFEIMKKHTTIGYEALKNASGDMGTDFFLNMAMDIILYHHERWDGNGYPKGLKGEDIPLAARVITIVDVYDALTSRRPYKEALNHEAAVDEMRKENGKFDPILINLFYKHADKFNEVREKYSETDFNDETAEGIA